MVYFEELLGVIECGELELVVFMDYQVKYVIKFIDDIKSGKVVVEMFCLEDCVLFVCKGVKKLVLKVDG